MAPRERLRGLRILVVEDNEDARDLLVMALSAHGATVLAAENGGKAIPLLSRERPHVVVTDLSMPVMDGYDVLRATRDALPDTPCVAVTAFALEHDRQATMDAGFDAHVPKPVDYRALVDLVLVLVTQRTAPASGEVRHETSGVRGTPKPKRLRNTG